MIIIKTRTEIETMRAGGRLLAGIFKEMTAYLKDGVSTQELNDLAEKLIAQKGAFPSFKNYRQYPKAICVSVNDEVVHGIPDEKKIILEEEEVNSGKTIWSLKLFEIDKNVKSQLINERNISKKESVQLLGLKFSPDSKKILLELGLKENIIYYLLEIDKAPSILTPLDFLGPEVEEVYFNPQNPKKLLALLASIKEEEGGTR